MLFGSDANIDEYIFIIISEFQNYDKYALYLAIKKHLTNSGTQSYDSATC